MIQIRHFAPAQFGEPLLEIRIARNVPAYPASLKWLLGGFALMCLAVAGIFALHGAVPVLGFAGLEIVLLFVLLRVSFRRAGCEEGVSVAGDATVVRRDGPNGVYEAARLSSYWLQIERAAKGIMLRSRDQRVTIGADLGAGETDDLAAALHGALHRVKTTHAGLA